MIALTQACKAERVLSFLAAALLLFFLLVYLHPYHGIRHDAILYLGQSLLRWQPEQFGQDLFFAYGSQAQYTLFPQVIAWFLSHGGAAGFFKWGTAFALFAFAASSAFVLGRLLPTGFRFFGLVAVIVLPAGYGGWNVFSYAEPFFTARSLAEPLVLLGVVAWLTNRWAMAGLVWALASIVHPLQALPVWVAAWLDRVSHDRRWLRLFWLVLPGLVAAVLGIKPFDSLLLRYDETWHRWIAEPNKHVFLVSWQPSAWGYLLTDLFLGWLILRRADGVLYRFARMVWLATILGVGFTLIFADGLHLVLPTGVQLWRAQWLLHWLAMACVPWLLIRDAQEGGKFPTRFVLLLAIVLLGTPSGQGDYTALAVLCLIPIYVFWERLASHVRPPLLKLLATSIPVALALMLFKHAQMVAVLYANSGGSRDVIRPEFTFFAFPLVAGGFVASGIWGWRRLHRLRLAFLALLLLASIHACGEWDRRSSWTRNIESAEYEPLLFGVELKPRAQVFWGDELLAPWLILHRPSYVNSIQSAGLLFNRGTAEEFYKRKKIIEALEFQSKVCGLMNELNRNIGTADSCSVSNEVVADVCAKADGVLDYLVLDQPLAARPLGSWQVMGGLKGDRPIIYRLYQCSDFSG